MVENSNQQGQIQTTMEKALHAYLDPLLNKHANGQLIVYNDLMSSWDSCQAILQHDDGNKEEAVQRLQKLHDSQLKAYTNAAQKALSDFAKTVKLPPVDLDVDEATYVDQVCKSLQVPEWNVNSKFVHIVVRKRAASLYHARQQEQAQMQNQKQQQTPIQQNYCENNDSKEHDTNLVDENNEDGMQTLNVTDDGDEGSGTGMDDTEDEEDDEDGEIVDSTVTGAKKLVKKNPRGNNINSSDNKKQQIKRKANSGKLPRLAMRGRKASSRGRGRGGGARGQARQA